MARTSFMLLFVIALVVAMASSLRDDKGRPVYDEQGNILRAGVPYYAYAPLLSTGVGGDPGGGLSFAKRNETLTVFQMPSIVNTGLPLFLSPAVGSQDEFIRESVDLIINFETFAPRSKFWHLADPEKATRRRYVTVSNTGNMSDASLFKIEIGFSEHLRIYKIVYCPSCGGKVSVCGDIGNSELMGRWLFLPSEPLVISFRKAKNEEMMIQQLK